MKMKTFAYLAALLLLLSAAFCIGTLAAESDTNLQTTVTCANTSTLALAANEGRIAAVLENDSSAAIYISIGKTAVVGEGFRLNGNGGSYTIVRLYGNYDSEAINCIVANGTGDILVTEWANQ